MTIALLFPGQGSQSFGMGHELAEAFPEAMAVVVEAEQRTGIPLRQLMWSRATGRLTSTDYAQVALYTISIAALRALEARCTPPVAFVAGHSLGEYSALVAAGAVSFQEGLQLVKLRGELMADAGRTAPGTMAAVLGMPLADLEEVCKEVAGTVVVANRNTTDQLVLSGDVAAVEAASALAKSRGAKRIMPLRVSGAFHSPLMAEAQAPLAAALARASWRDARYPVVCNVDAKPHTAASEFPDLLTRQLESPVRWAESIATMADAGVDTFIELGAGKVLTGMIRKLVPGAHALATEDLASFHAACERLGAPVGGRS